jgi:3-hydroxyacyl-CoA dehydrogenase
VALHAALVNEGARMIQARAVLRASDIDLCLVRGYGFDPAQGGPLLAADIAGLLGLVRAMKQLAPLSESLWAPQPMVEDLVKYGRRFFGPVS